MLWILIPPLHTTLSSLSLYNKHSTFYSKTTEIRKIVIESLGSSWSCQPVSLLFNTSTLPVTVTICSYSYHLQLQLPSAVTVTICSYSYHSAKSVIFLYKYEEKPFLKRKNNRFQKRYKPYLSLIYRNHNSFKISLTLEDGSRPNTRTRGVWHCC